MEIKIPWQLLNFSNPAEMQIHDDYYENYGREHDRGFHVGGHREKPHAWRRVSPWENWSWKDGEVHPPHHERLKESHYIGTKKCGNRRKTKVWEFR